MHKQVRLTAAGTLAAVGISALLAVPATASDSGRNLCSEIDQSSRPSLSVVGLANDQRLVCFSEKKPGKTTTIGFVAGLSGGDTTLVGMDYRVNDLDPTTNTTLYDLDSNLDQIAVQSPPNNGSLVANGKLTVDATAVAGDTHSTLRNGVTVAVRSLAAITTADGVTRLYSINVPTGKASVHGTFKPEDAVLDIAIPLNQL